MGPADFASNETDRRIVVGDDGEVAGKKAIMGALRLYLDFINLFMMLMQLLGTRRD